MLPVVGRRLNVLGGLSRTALRRGFQEYRAAERRPRTVLDSIVGALLLTTSALLRLLFQSSSAAPAPASREASRER